MTERHIHTDEASDLGADVSDAVKARASAAEDEVFLKHLLGIDVSFSQLSNPINRLNIANQIAMRVCSNVDATRYGVSEAALAEVLDQRIEHALERIAPRHASVSRQHRLAELSDPRQLQIIRAVADAVRESVPQALLDDLVRFGMPVALDAKNSGLPRHHIAIEDIDLKPSKDKYTIVVDTRHQFWRENGPFDDENAFIEALKGRKIVELGITTMPSDLPHSYKLTEDDAKAIAAGKFELIDVQNRHDEVTGSIPGIGSYRVNTDTLASTLINDPACLTAIGLPGRAEAYAGSLTGAHLQSLFEYSPAGGHFPYWERFVSGIGTRPPTTPHPLGGTLSSRVTYEIFSRLGRAIADPLSIASLKLFEIQTEIQHQHKYHRRLREGSDNAAGAAFAQTILMRYKDLEPSIGLTRELSEITKELDKAKEHKQLSESLEKLEAFSSPNTHAPWDIIKGKLATIAISRPVTNGTHIILAAGTPYQESFTVGTLPRDITDGFSWLREREQLALTDQASYYKVQSSLLPVYNLAAKISGKTSGPPKILDLFAAGPPPIPHFNEFIPGMSFADLANEVKKELEMKTKSEYDAEVDKLKKEKKEIEEGRNVGLYGDKAQHAVIKNYLIRYHGMTDAEATAGSNYLRSRSLLDSELSSHIEEVIAGAYGDEVTLGERNRNRFENLQNFSFQPEDRSARIIEQIGHACRISSRRGRLPGGEVSTHLPDWTRASYENLCVAYFALKKIYEGAGVPQNIRLQRTRFVQAQMQEIARTLTERHANRILSDLGVSAPVEDKDAAAIQKDPTKNEHAAALKEFIRGSAPAKYEPRISEVIADANRRTDWIRYHTLTHENYGLTHGKKLPFSARNLLWGNKYLSLYGSNKFLLYTAPKYVVSKGKELGKKGWQTTMKHKWAAVGGVAGLLIGCGNPLMAGVGAWAGHYLGKHFGAAEGGHGHS